VASSVRATGLVSSVFYIVGKLTLAEARRRTVEEHETIIAALERRDHAAYVSALDQHRANSPLATPALRAVGLDHPFSGGAR